MDSRIAIIGVFVYELESANKINNLLHEYSQYIIGRMGLPYKQKGINIISIVLDAPADVISTLSGKIGMLKGVSVKALYAKAPQEQPF